MIRPGLEFHRVRVTDWRGGILAAAPHETDDDLELYALGRLSDERAASVEEHLLICAACQKRLDDVEAFAVAMREAIGGEPVPTALHWLDRWRQPGFAWTGLAWAGGLAALLAAIGLFLHVGTSSVAPLATLQLTAVRGETQTVIPSRETDITLTDAPAADDLKAEVIDAAAGTVWTGILSPKDGNRIRLTKRLEPGGYFVRLYGDNGKLLHEYGFEVRAAR